MAFTNDYGVTFRNRVVTGFSPTIENGRFVYLDFDCWWFPVRPDSIVKETEGASA